MTRWLKAGDKVRLTVPMYRTIGTKQGLRTLTIKVGTEGVVVQMNQSNMASVKFGRRKTLTVSPDALQLITPLDMLAEL